MKSPPLGSLERGKIGPHSMSSAVAIISINQSGAMINFHASNGFNQGHNLHILSLTDFVTYTIPVFPAQ